MIQKIAIKFKQENESPSYSRISSTMPHAMGNMGQLKRMTSTSVASNYASYKSGPLGRGRTKELKQDVQDVIKTVEKPKISYDAGNPLADLEQRDF